MARFASASCDRGHRTGIFLNGKFRRRGAARTGPRGLLAADFLDHVLQALHVADDEGVFPALDDALAGQVVIDVGK